MAYGGHICRENYEFANIKGPMLMSANSRGLDLHRGYLVPWPAADTLSELPPVAASQSSPT
jgi:hypothetical protein